MLWRYEGLNDCRTDGTQDAGVMNREVSLCGGRGGV